MESLIPSVLTPHRTTCCHLLTPTVQSKAPITDLVPSLRHVVEHTSRLTGSLRMIPSGISSISYVSPMSRKTRMRMIPSKISLVASLDSLDLTARRQLRIITSTVLQMLHMISRGRLRHRFDCQRLKLFLTIKRKCLCSLPISRQRSLPTMLTQQLRNLETRISLRTRSHLLPTINSFGRHRLCKHLATLLLCRLM